MTLKAADNLQTLNALGQAPWLDSITRSWITTGELARMRDKYSLRGVTSNPSIFRSALSSGEYNDDIRRLAGDGLDDRAIFHQLAIEDIRATCDIFAEVHANTGDGFVSIEVDPDLAHDTEKTLEQARTLHATIDRPNVMIKIPATEAGLPAIEQALREGISVNITLLFDVEMAKRVREAWLSALTARLDAGETVAGIASVSSFFVSRVDTKVDAILDARSDDESREARGTAAVANAVLAWYDAQSVLQDERWLRLKEAGASMQRLLWASTGTKDTSYSNVKYVNELVAAGTVNTMPLGTLEAYAEDDLAPKIAITEARVERAKREVARLAACGVDLDQVTAELRDEGVAAFVNSLDELLGDVATARKIASA